MYKRQGDGRLDFKTVFHDAVKVHQPFHVFVGHLRHLRGIEIAKGFAVAFPLFEAGYPAQSRLGTFQYKNCLLYTSTTAYANTDWFSEIYKGSSFSQEHNFSVSGGGDKFNYYASLGSF